MLVTAPMLSEQRSPYYEDFMKNAPNVWHEWHPYYKWGYEGKTEGQIIQAAANYENAVRNWQGNPLTISEWSMGTHEQSAPFNDISEYKNFGQTMLQSFKTARGGYFFWSWRHSDDGRGIRTGWSMRALMRSNMLSV